MTGTASQVGMETLGAVSLRPGEVRLTDIQRQIEPKADGRMRLLALSALGIPIILNLEFAQKWSTHGWSLQLACPQCRQPCRVLRERHGQFVCARCGPVRSAHHRRKNTRDWAQYGGKEVSQLVLALGQAPSGELLARNGALEELTDTVGPLIAERAGRLVNDVAGELETLSRERF